MAFSNDPFERLTFGNVFSRSFTLLMERLDLFMVIAVLMYIPFLLIQWTFPIDPASMQDPTNAETNPFISKDENGEPNQLMMGKLAGVYAELFFSTFVGIVGNAAIALAVGQLYINGHPDTSQCLKKGLGSFCTLFCGSCFVGIITGAAIFIVAFIGMLLWFSGYAILRFLTILLAVAAVSAYFYLNVALTLFIPAVMIEQKDAVNGLKRSFELVTKNFCFVFCTSFCLSLIMGFINIAVSLFTLDGMLGTAIAKLPFLIQFPLQAILMTVVYFNIRVTHEGLNRDVLARELNWFDGDYSHVVATDVEAEAIAVVEKV